MRIAMVAPVEMRVPPVAYLTAGLPWFMAVFGRDSIISAIQTTCCTA